MQALEKVLVRILAAQPVLDAIEEAKLSCKVGSRCLSDGLAALGCGHLLFLCARSSALLLALLRAASHRWSRRSLARLARRRLGFGATLRAILGQEILKLLEQVLVILEQLRHLRIHVRNAFLRLSVQVENLQELLVDALVVREALLDLVYVRDCLIELHRLLRIALLSRRRLRWQFDLVRRGKKRVEAEDERPVSTKQNLHLVNHALRVELL
mmetsp:Transcript_8536/g.21865  ORF Transcript_8536/g.21865 Transcript_8536/m.21865 type:complete len:213 (-) Transcript_8536:385-1023(-)